MPTRSATSTYLTYVGIDPGVNGAIAIISQESISLYKMPDTDMAVWDVITPIIISQENYAESILVTIEQQIPRPTHFYNKELGKWTSSILKSTCLLYGNYMLIKGMLTVSLIPYESCPPKRWQKALGIPAREKGVTDSVWKNILKQRAQQLYPSLGITLATADALLIAHYCKLKAEGKLLPGS